VGDSARTPPVHWLYLGRQGRSSSLKASVLLAYGAGFHGSANWEQDGYSDWFLDDGDVLWNVERDAH
jgi:hypothetical protein